MSSTNSTSDSSANAQQDGTSLESDLAMLTKLINQSMSPNDEADANFQELLSCLQAADGIAEGVESRVDGIISHLDGLLDGLENEVSESQKKDQATKK
ncbi:hypothetical protein ONZ45_g445 [Pleurotus djamor]|nr:hypothetical protein ONZ45_g445 [Pleurotus djamor]